MTENISAVTPVVERYSILLSIPLDTSVSIPKNPDKAEEALTQKRKSLPHSAQVELTSARLLLHYAECCGAKLERMYNENGKLMMNFSFPRLDALLTFRNGMGRVALQL